MSVHAFNPNTQEAETGLNSVSLKPAWSTEQLPGQPELHGETLSQKTQERQKESRDHAVEAKGIRIIWEPLNKLRGSLTGCHLVRDPAINSSAKDRSPRVA